MFGSLRSSDASLVGRARPDVSAHAAECEAESWNGRVFRLEMAPADPGVRLQLISYDRRRSVEMVATVRDPELAEYLARFLEKSIELKHPNALVVRGADQALRRC